ncbi:TetR family transcriptional regulator [Paenibacillus sp. LHD-117]|uniref:TetR/AcrR family transcriptional regulator n=1 Tax=Paenibacillus sp. LHD-117 TaxID=3071412 RepID=UPI0027E1FD6A|nr:TetR family transcriptional regulator [Paenibacillus sp. LHD-117]MDQ6418439.1 TetR family transcriptional regulator [Paenibacillus sp. LHD-117]
MGEIRNAERTRRAILEAARAEFFEKGYSGARIEAIANRAGVKKQLLYHYFKGKDELYEEVMAHLLGEWNPEFFMMPANPIRVAEHRFKINAEQILDFLRFTVWEAIDPRPGSLMGEEKRRKVLQSYIDDMKSKQEIGLVPDDLDPALLTLAISSLTIYPLIFGDVTRMITGKLPTDPEFQAEWTSFLHTISERIFKSTTK